eukprot:GHVS01037889.1.p3 GENE.GHVS01037889.1~~GHVS01037889.1.p3  ORF type:complete len:238 (-),score=74.25 GHVS01037889.1:1051-1764(-)
MACPAAVVSSPRRVSTASSTSSISPSLAPVSTTCLSQEQAISNIAIDGFFSELEELVEHVQTAARSIVETVSLPPLAEPSSSSSPTLALLKEKIGKAKWLEEEVDRLQRGQELSLEEILKALHDLHAINEQSIADIQRHFAELGHPTTASLLTTSLEAAAVCTPSATNSTELSCQLPRQVVHQQSVDSLPSPSAAPVVVAEVSAPDLDSLGLSAHTLQLLSAKPSKMSAGNDQEMEE